MQTRLAVETDLPAIMKIEKESFGKHVGAEGMALEDIMRQRIQICNSVSPGWFWVAETDESLCGYIVLQPTELSISQCVSWDVATDHGTLRSTFSVGGETVFGVSMGVATRAPSGAFYSLLQRTILQTLRTGKTRLMLCSRLPNLKREAERGVPPEIYWKLTDPDGLPCDRLLRKFYSAFGVGPIAFLRDGWPVDVDSGGHAALVVVEDLFLSLEHLAQRLYASGKKDAERSLKESTHEP